jgi:probable F420-dependent oxidoreductase
VRSDRITFSVQADVTAGATEWLDLAVKVEDLGFEALYVADHVGISASPFPALAAAAAVTTTLRLGTYVLNCGTYEPLVLASAAATLDRLSDGRAIVGVGAGHTPSEWTMSGRTYPSAAARVGRLAEMIDVVTALLRGETVTHHGPYLDLDDAVLAAPRPVQERIPLLVGGNGRAVVDLAGRTADIVSLSGSGRTLEDGHRHEVEWSAEAIDERVAIVRRASASRPPDRDASVLDALVQYVEITDRRADAAAMCAQIAGGTSAADVLAAPYVLVGTVDELAAELTEHHERRGFSSYVVRADAVDAIAHVIERLR